MPICLALLIFLVAQVCGAPADSTLDINATLLNQSQTTLDEHASASTWMSQKQTSEDEPVPDTALMSQTRTSQDDPVLPSTQISQIQNEPVSDSGFTSQIQTSQDEPVSHSIPISQTQTTADQLVPDSTLALNTETLREQRMSDYPASPENLETSDTNTVSLMTSVSEPSDRVTVAPLSTSQNESLTLKADSVINTDQMQTKTEVIDATPTWSDSSSSSLSLNDYILRLFDPDASYSKCTDVVSSWYDAWRKARRGGPTEHSEIHSSCFGCSSESMSNTGFVTEAPTETYTEIGQSDSFRFRSEFNDLDPTETGEVMSYTADISLSFSQGSEISERIMLGETTSDTVTAYSSAVDSLNVSSVNYMYISSSNDRATVEFVSEMYNVSATNVSDSPGSSFSERLESTLMNNDAGCTDCISPSSVAITGSTTNITNTFQGPPETKPLDLSLVVSTGTMSAELDLQSSTSQVPTMIVYYNFSGSIVFCETTVPPKVLVSSSSAFLETVISDSTASLSSVTSDGTVVGEGTARGDTTPRSGSNTGGNTSASDGSTGPTTSGPGTGSGGGSGTTRGPATGLTNPGDTGTGSGSGTGTGTGTGTSPVVQALSTTPQPTTRKKSNNMSRSVVIGLVCGVAFCVGFLVMCLCFYKFCCNGPSISPQLFNYKPHDPHFLPSPSPATSHRAKRIFVAD
ncbi:uncharacterized protein [Haliotis asinina]|uniref:uncharacterized protein n=1 Tax=Haliotis asinina TaxID=109174 RepID=UPI003531EC2A